MGYTHYWYQRRDATATEWDRITAAAARLIERTDVPLALEYDEPSRLPIINDSEIRFNGIGDHGHETFRLTRLKGSPLVSIDDGSTFDFCKTAHKPYDIVVCAILTAVHYYAPEAWRVSSDGDPDDWRPATAFVKAALGTEMPIPLSDGV